MHYEYMERKTAKVSSDFHVRFDNAYYSVDKAFLHKKVSIKASSTVVRIYSLTGEFLCEWPRATRKGQWSTNADHLPDNYKGFTQWNAPYFIQKAQLIGKNTETVIRTILKSRPLPIFLFCISLHFYFTINTYKFSHIDTLFRRKLFAAFINSHYHSYPISHNSLCPKVKNECNTAE